MDSRIFIGIKIPGEIGEGLIKIQNELKLAELKAKFVEAENLHINLKFLGDTPNEEIEKISFAVQNTADNFKKFNIEVKGLGFFPESNNPRVIWAGVSSEEIFKLHDLLESNLSNIGLPRDSRNFSPHITLARIKSADKEKLRRVIQNNDSTIGIFEASEITLVKSELSEEGPSYSDIRKFRLGD